MLIKRVVVSIGLLAILVGARWQPLETVIIQPGSGNLSTLPEVISEGLAEAIESLSSLILVKAEPDEKLVKTHRIMRCAKSEAFNTTQFTVNYFVPNIKSQTVPVTPKGLDISQIPGNFYLFLSVNAEPCKNDKFMLAGASPCMNPDASLGSVVPRPVCGRLVICLDNLGRQHFGTTYDLFRHEIMHALGFGTIIPDRYNNATMPSKNVPWTIAGGEQSFQRTVHYMDFAERATKTARKYFKCSTIYGIEADNEDKMHLNEYIFGNELMTPVISKDENHFTILSASILESTYLGTIPWYYCNKTSVGLESKKYWYGRGWGCSFVEQSCDSFIQNAKSTNRGTSFPFCSETDLYDYLYTQKQIPICFSNGKETVQVLGTCNLSKRLIQPQTDIPPLTLLRQYPRLRRLLDVVGYPIYGSDASHRYCPMIQEILQNRIIGLPDRAYVVPCA